MEFRQSRVGRRMALVLLGGALIIWAFAIWMFGATLGLSWRDFSTSVRALISSGLEMARAVPAFLLLVLIVASPLLVWSLLVECMARYEVSDAGLRFRSLGANLLLPWQSIRSVRAEPFDEPSDELLTSDDPLAQIRSPLLYGLYRQAFGRGRVPVYSGIENRDVLIAEIQRRAGFSHTSG